MRQFILALAMAFTTSLHAQPMPATPPSITDDETANDRLLAAGAGQLRAGKPAEALTDYVDKVIQSCEDKYHDALGTVYAARSMTEGLFYLTQAAHDKREAIVVKPTCATAYFMKAYALVELHRVVEGKTALQKAITRSPQNSQFLSEMAHLYVLERNWTKSMETYALAEKATEFSPPEIKSTELARAWRGMAYVDVELGKFAEAEGLYTRCLKVDPNDKAAAAELQYVQKRRSVPASK